MWRLPAFYVRTCLSASEASYSTYLLFLGVLLIGTSVATASSDLGWLPSGAYLAALILTALAYPFLAAVLTLLVFRGHEAPTSS
jgi:multisubunit Na+/H+ antiporter MnhG subunit